MAISRSCQCGARTNIDLPDPAAVERNAAAFDRVHSSCVIRVDAGQLAFLVRDLLDAAAYDYRPDRGLIEQVRECCDWIRDGWEKRRELDRLLVVAVDRHAAEKQQLTDLVEELRKHVEAQTRRAERAERGDRTDGLDGPGC